MEGQTFFAVKQLASNTTWMTPPKRPLGIKFLDFRRSCVVNKVVKNGVTTAGQPPSGSLDPWNSSKTITMLTTISTKSLRYLITSCHKYLRLVKQIHRRELRTAPIYQFGVRVPRNHAEAVEFDGQDQRHQSTDGSHTCSYSILYGSLFFRKVVRRKG